MGMTTDGLSYWQAESEGIDLKQSDVQALFFMARVRDYDHLATIHSLIRTA